MRIAVDNQIGDIAIRTISTKHTVVVRAQDYSDQDWLDAAIGQGAIAIVSPDLDVPNYLDKHAPHIRWICLPQGLRDPYIGSFVLNKLAQFNKHKSFWSKR